MHLYCILNTRNGKRYIGLTTVSVATRWNAHVREALGGAGRALCKAIRKYGAEAFVVEQIASMVPGTSWNDLCDMEIALIAQEGTFGPGGYNMTAGGEGVPGYAVTDEQKAAQAASFRATYAQRKADGTWPDGPNKGKKVGPRSAETRAKISAAQKGRAAYPASVAAVKESWTPERRAKAAKRAKELTAMPRTPERQASQAAKMRAYHAQRRAMAANPPTEGVH